MFNFGRKKKKVPKEGEDYKFIDFTNSELTGIMVLKGEYAGIVYHYGKVRVKEQGEFATLEFGFTLVNSGKHDIDLLQKDEEFVTIMGDILSEILTKSDNEPIRTNHIEESDLL
jgi:hypothetical protein